MAELESKRAIVTGAASGIGRASAELFAREGAALLLCDVDAAVEQVASEIRDAGGHAQALVADVADERTSERLVAQCVERFGGLEVVFANAGVVHSITPLVDLGADEFDAVWRVNVMGTFFALKHGARYLVDHGGGAMLCTASVAGLRSGGGPLHYSASKAAVINMVQTSASQLAGTGVRVNAICPGLVETAMTAPIFELARSLGKEDRIGQLNPTKRAAKADEIARVALFLASDAASYVNGEALVVDGGLASSLPMVPGKQW